MEMIYSIYSFIYLLHVSSLIVLHFTFSMGILAWNFDSTIIVMDDENDSEREYKVSQKNCL